MSVYTPTTEQVRLDYVMAYSEKESSQILAERDFDRWLAEVERVAAEKVLVELETELVGSMEDGTYLAPWTELTANEVREKIWELFDSHRKEQGDECTE